ncbi:hypothetical protein A1O3_08242 [Capronia epimyces CBS 606.96]|uniref:Uncharacterized protein n=1 Tax=Capronia epimyces CBS 606.96 TaxID=1182542 RepID=W9XSL3_9EURO|nr:uncharacterized protein A1O3_08242 [Capronia epimyces CBS 606.96]EXJ79956.1 hypothetical protein A1O3_08242 [Capronia epimyces CBS 606.96]
MDEEAYLAKPAPAYLAHRPSHSDLSITHRRIPQAALKEHTALETRPTTPSQPLKQYWSILIAGVILLIIPLWALSSLETERSKLGAISLLIVCFVALLATDPPIHPGQILAAAAA